MARVALLGRVLLLTLAFFIKPALLTAQSEPLYESWRWFQFTEAPGLTGVLVRDVVETTGGTPWARTNAVGVAWYDGFRWHPVGVAEGLPPEVPIEIVPDLQDGILVLAGGHLYQGDQRGFTEVRVASERGAPGVTSVAPLDEESFLVLTGGQLHLRHPGGLQPFPVPPEVISSDDALAKVSRTSNGGIWLHSELGTFQWDGERWDQRFPHNATLLRDDSIGGVLATVAGQTPFRGLWTWGPGNPPSHLADPRNLGVVAMDTDPGGDAIAVYVGGRVRVRRGGQWRWLSPAPDPLVNVRFVRIQRSGDAWIGAQRSLFLYRASSTRWTRWSETEGEAVLEILPTSGGDTWIGTSSGIFIRRRNGTTERLGSIMGTPLAAVTALAEDREGGVWIGSGSAFPGAFRWHQDSWQHFGPRDGLQAPRIHKIVKDRRGRLWFLGLASTFLGGPDDPHPGAYVYDGSQFTRWGTEEGLPDGRVYAFAEGPDDVLWFGTFAGLSRWREGQWTHWSFDQGPLPRRVFALTVGTDGRAWFGHRFDAGGLGFIDQRDSVAYLRVPGSEANNEVADLRFGRNETLWLGTHDGLSRYRDGTFATLGSWSGLAQPQVWPVVPLVDRVYVGTTGGGVYVLRFEERADTPPQVVLSSPIVDARSVLIRWLAFPFWGETPSAEVQTRYRVDDGPWSGWGAARELALTGVAAGGHGFEVQAKGLLGSIGVLARTTFSVPLPIFLQPRVFTPLGALIVTVIGLGTAQLYRRRRMNAERRQAEAELASAFEWQEAIVQGSRDAILITDTDARFVQVNRAATQLTGYSEDELLEMRIPDLHAEADLSAYHDFHGPLMAGEEYVTEARILRKDGTKIDTEFNNRRITVGDQSYLHTVARDVSMRKRLEQEILEISERERRRAGLELHDGVGQQLTGIGFLSEVLARRLRDRKLPEAVEAARVVELVQEATRGAHDLARGLYPADLHAHGLLPALEEMASHIENIYSVRCRIEGGSLEHSFRRDAETHLYRIAQEAVLNAVKHGQPSSVVIRLTSENGRTTLTVEDDGSGVGAGETEGRGMGVDLMRYRARMLDALFSLRPGPDGGTIVECSLVSRGT